MLIGGGCDTITRRFALQISVPPICFAHGFPWYPRFGFRYVVRVHPFARAGQDRAGQGAIGSRGDSLYKSVTLLYVLLMVSHGIRDFDSGM